MAKAFSLASWNVEHFGAKNKNKDKPEKDVGTIIEFLAQQKADVVAVYEVVGKTVFKEVVQRMPDYQFHITEGPQTQEILVGARKKLQSFFTQKTEYRSGQSTLRPGALLTLVVGGQTYPILFLHLKSLSVPKGFGLRDDQTDRAIKFRKVLDKAHVADGGEGHSNFLFLGDLNTMGMNLTYMNKDISGPEEIERLRKRLSHKSVNMTILDKPAGKQVNGQEATYWPGLNSSYPPGNLDHVVAADHLEFKRFGGASVDVRGWVDQSTDAKKQDWTEKYSDHSLLYFEVQKV